MQYTCVICGLLSDKQLCKQHRKCYYFVKQYNIWALKARICISIPQTALFRNIRAVFKCPCFQEVTFDWLKYKRFDIVVPDKKLICEVDGKQHFVRVKLFHKTVKEFEKFKIDEKNKQQIAEKMGYKVVRFSYVEDVGNINYVIKKLEINNVW